MTINNRSVLIVALLLCGTMSGFAKKKDVKPHDWKTGMLIAANAQRVEPALETWRYEIDDGNYVWTLGRDIEVGRNFFTGHHDKPLSVTINTPVKFAIGEDVGYLQDEQGKEHKVSVKAKALKQAKQ